MESVSDGTVKSGQGKGNKGDVVELARSGSAVRGVNMGTVPVPGSAGAYTWS